MTAEMHSDRQSVNQHSIRTNHTSQTFLHTNRIILMLAMRNAYTALTDTCRHAVQSRQTPGPNPWYRSFKFVGE